MKLFPVFLLQRQWNLSLTFLLFAFLCKMLCVFCEVGISFSLLFLLLMQKRDCFSPKPYLFKFSACDHPAHVLQNEALLLFWLDVRGRLMGWTHGGAEVLQAHGIQMCTWNILNTSNKILWTSVLYKLSSFFHRIVSEKEFSLALPVFTAVRRNVGPAI